MSETVYRLCVLGLVLVAALSSLMLIDVKRPVAIALTFLAVLVLLFYLWTERGLVQALRPMLDVSERLP